MDNYVELAKEIRKKLHTIAEPSLHEVKTKSFLIDYIKENTDLEIIDKGKWFYVKHTIDSNNDYIAFRCDFDAVTGEDGISRHLCGHDGHASSLAAFAKWISDNKPKKNIILLFQHAEEIGAGGKDCKEILNLENISEIFGFHNIPGYELGNVLILDGTFACGSVGYEIIFTGKPAHAAYPETGINPTKAISQLVIYVDDYINQEHDGVVLSTVVGIESGSNHFGVSASEGTLRLTLRAEKSNEFEKLIGFVKDKAQTLAKDYSLELAFAEFDYFPATENNNESNSKLRKVTDVLNYSVVLPDEPFRWSEDFGWYLQNVKGAYFGIGVGSNHPQIHTEKYEFNDDAFSYILNVLKELINY